jgi:hypothetical protein
MHAYTLCCILLETKNEKKKIYLAAATFEAATFEAATFEAATFDASPPAPACPLVAEFEASKRATTADTLTPLLPLCMCVCV